MRVARRTGGFVSVAEEVGTTRWGDREARDRDIRAAAAAIVENDGVGALSMRAVAAGAGVSLGTLYLYYKSKEDLYATLFADRIQQLEAELAEEVAGAQTLREALRIALLRFVDLYRLFEIGFDIEALAADLDEGSSELQRRLQASTNRLIEIAWDVFTRIEPTMGLVDQRDRLLVAQTIWVVARGLAEQAAVSRYLELSEPAELLDFTVDVMIDGHVRVLGERLRARGIPNG